MSFRFIQSLALLLLISDAFAEYSDYSVSYFDSGVDSPTERMLEMDDGLLIVQEDGLRFFKRVDEGYKETWTNMNTGIRLGPEKVYVEGDRIYFLYVDEENLTRGKVFEKDGDSFREIGTIDLSPMRENWPYVHMFEELLVRDGVVYVIWTKTFNDDPRCTIFEEEESVWRSVGFIDFGIPSTSAFWDMITVVGSGDERSLFFARRPRESLDVEGDLYDMDRYVPTPDGWELAQTYVIEVDNFPRGYDAIVDPSQESFIVANLHTDSSAQLQVFSKSEAGWKYDGYLDLPEVDPERSELFGSDSGYLVIHDWRNIRLKGLRYVEGSWQITATAPVPLWDNRSLLSDVFLTSREIIVFDPLREPFSTEDFKVALLSSQDLSLYVNQPWFSEASFTGFGGEWHPALGYYGIVSNNSGDSAWIRTEDFGWLYTTSRNGYQFVAWSANLQSWTYMDLIHVDPAHKQPFLYLYDHADYVWSPDLSSRFFSVKRRNWVSAFDATVFTDGSGTLAPIVSEWDWEISGEDPSLRRSKVTVEVGSSDWEQELYAYLEDQFWTLRLYGSWGVRRQPDGYLSEIRITINVDEVDVFSKDGSVRFNVERAWTEYDLLLPQQYILNVSFESADEGRTTGTILFNSGETEPLPPFDFPYEDPPPRI